MGWWIGVKVTWSFLPCMEYDQGIFSSSTVPTSSLLMASARLCSHMLPVTVVAPPTSFPIID